MAESCQRCGAQAHNAFLCRDCVGELHDLLQGLVSRTSMNPVTGESCVSEGWLGLLEDAARGNTRLGVSVRHSTEHSQPLPFNERASDLLTQAEQCLYRWVTEINLKNETLGEQ